MKTPSLNQSTLAAPGPERPATHQQHSRSDSTDTPPAPSWNHPAVVSAEEWLVARRELLRHEKDFTRQRDALAARQRALPWVRMDKPYMFDSPRGRVSLADLFGPHRQLIIQHFMFGPGWEEGCKACSFMTDHIAPTIPHLAARDVSFAAVSHAPLAEILPFQRRMGWKINWVSAYDTDFNTDFHVSFAPDEITRGQVYYNYALREVPKSELPGISVFAKDAAGTVFHTYSTYGRGVELVMATYKLLDLVPKGRNEAGLEYGMEWLRYHDRYEPALATA